jgi:hypothetical protein
VNAAKKYLSRIALVVVALVCFEARFGPVLGLPGVPSANAQTPGLSFRVSVGSSGAPPTGVTGMSVVLRCFRNADVATEVTQEFSLSFGTTPINPSSKQIDNWPPLPLDGLSCRVSATISGTGDTSVGETQIFFGPSTGPSRVFAGFAPQLDSGYVPITSESTNIALFALYKGPVVVGVSGDSVSPTGEPFEVSIACDQGGPKDVFLLNPGERRVYPGISTGSNCLVTETQNRGATVTYQDTSGTNLTDGRISPGRVLPGCPSPNSGDVLNGACWAGILITNRSSVAPSASTTTSTTTTSISISTVAPGTSAPVVSVAVNTTNPAASSVTSVASTTPSPSTTTEPVRTTTTTNSAVTTTTTATTTTISTPVAKQVRRALKGLKVGSRFVVRNGASETVAQGVVGRDGIAHVSLPLGTYRSQVTLRSGRRTTVTVRIK